MLPCAVTEVALEEVIVCATVAEPVPVNELVGELLPPVVLATVMIAVFAPALAGVNVTSYVAVPPPAAMVCELKLLTTNCASFETTVIPAAAMVPLFVMV